MPRSKKLTHDFMEPRILLNADPGVAALVPPSPDAEDPDLLLQIENRSLDTPGFAPFFDLVFPEIEGDAFERAEHNGHTLETYELVFPNDGNGTGTLRHPLAVDANGDPLLVTGNAGDTLVVVRLPFRMVGASGASDPISVFADVDDAASVAARGGFALGNDAFMNPASDPSVVGSFDAVPAGASDIAFKSIVATSEVSTVGETVTIGEIVRYRLTVELPESSLILPDVALTDFLPEGMRFIDPSEVRLSFIADQAFETPADLAGADNDATPPTFVFPESRITSSGSEVRFDIGDLRNNDNDLDAELLILEFNAVVANAPGVDAGVTLENSFFVFASDVIEEMSNDVTLKVVEPGIASITKTLVGDAPGDAGDSATFELTFENTGDTDAFETRLTDLLPEGLVLDTGSVTVSGAMILSDNSTGTGLDVTLAPLAPGSGPVTLRYTAVVADDAGAGATLGSAAMLSYSSLPGGNGTDPNPTGSTSGAPGSETGERDGSGGVNDYTAMSNSVPIELDTPTVEIIVTDDTGAIGEEVVFDLLITLPEGVTDDLSITHLLPEGLRFLGFEIVTDAASSNGAFADNFDSSIPKPVANTPGAAGDDLVLDFGAVTADAGPGSSDNQFIVRVLATPVNDLGNQAGVVLDTDASLTFRPPDAGLVDVGATGAGDVTVVEPVLDFAVQVLSMPTGLLPGDTVVYQATITHDGSSTGDAFDVSFSDLAAMGIVLTNIVSVTGSGASGVDIQILPDGSAITGSFDLALGQTLVIEYEGLVQPGVAPLTTLVNDASVAWTSTAGANPDERTGIDGLLDDGSLNDYRLLDAAAVETGEVTERPDLALTITDNADNPVPGEVIDYIVTVLNKDIPTGSDASNALVTVELPEGVTFIESSSPFFVAQNGRTLTFSIPMLAVGEQVDLGIRVSVDAPAASGLDTLTITGEVTHDDTDQTPGDNAAVNTDTLVAAPDYAVTITDGDPSSVGAGDTVPFEIGVANNGNQVGTNVVVTSLVPDGVDPTDISDGGVYDPVTRVITWMIPTLAPGDQVTLTYTGVVGAGIDPSVTGFTTTASVTDDGSDGPDPNPADNTASVVTELGDTTPDLELMIADNAENPEPGDVIDYVVTVLNKDLEGGGDASDVVVTFTLPEGVTFAESNSPFLSSVDGSTLTFTIPALAIGESIDLGVRVSVDDPARAGLDEIVASASVTHADPDPTPGDNTAINTDTLVAAPDYGVTIGDGDPDPVEQGDTVGFEIEVANNGNQSGTNVVVTSLVPRGVDPTDISDGGVFDPTTRLITWMIPELAPGDALTLTYSGVVTADISAGATRFVTTASVTDDGSNGPDPNPADNTASVVTQRLFTFVYDGNNDSRMMDDEIRPFTTIADRVARALQDDLRPPLSIDPVFTGTARPGSTVTVELFGLGSEHIGSRSVVADAAGNWAASVHSARIQDWVGRDPAPEAIQTSRLFTYSHGIFDQELSLLGFVPDNDGNATRGEIPNTPYTLSLNAHDGFAPDHPAFGTSPAINAGMTLVGARGTDHLSLAELEQLARTPFGVGGLGEQAAHDSR